MPATLKSYATAAATSFAALFFGALFVAPAFFSAQYRRMASICRCRPSGLMLLALFFVLALPGGLPGRPLGSVPLTSLSAARALSIAALCFSSRSMMVWMSFKDSLPFGLS